MLPRGQRLAQARELVLVQRRGLTRQNRYFKLRFLIRPNATSSRATVIASKRVSKRAVDRNRLKRQVRALLLGHLRKNKGRVDKVKVDLVISILPPALKASFSTLKKSLDELLV